MGVRDTKMEAELENNIIDCLVNEQGYEYIKPEKIKLSFNRKYAIDEERLLRFIKTSQPNEFDILRLDIESGRDKFYKQLDFSIKQDGIVSVLKNGIKCYPS